MYGGNPIVLLPVLLSAVVITSIIVIVIIIQNNNNNKLKNITIPKLTIKQQEEILDPIMGTPTPTMQDEKYPYIYYPSFTPTKEDYLFDENNLQPTY